MQKTSIKAEFSAASRERQLRFSANIIEEMAEKGKSDRKITEYLEKIGADPDVVAEAFELAEAEGLISEGERAKAEADAIIRAEGGISVKAARKALSKLAYLGFDEETLTEISERLNEQLEEWQ